jgi:hypothetical protein
MMGRSSGFFIGGGSKAGVTPATAWLPVRACSVGSRARSCRPVPGGIGQDQALSLVTKMVGPVRTSSLLGPGHSPIL